MIKLTKPHLSVPFCPVETLSTSLKWLNLDWTEVCSTDLEFYESQHNDLISRTQSHTNRRSVLTGPKPIQADVRIIQLKT